MLKAQILVNFNLRGEYLIQGLIMLGKNLPTQLSLVLFFLFFVTETKLSRLALNLQSPCQITRPR